MYRRQFYFTIGIISVFEVNRVLLAGKLPPFLRQNVLFYFKENSSVKTDTARKCQNFNAFVTILFMKNGRKMVRRELLVYEVVVYGDC